VDRKRILIIAGVAGGLILAVAAIVFAMGGEDEPVAAATTTTVVTTLPPVTTQATTTSSTTTTTTTTLPSGPPSLLNGLPVDDETLQERRVIAVKVDNHPEARPQSGIQDAGAVIELVVEAGITRFIALFHDTDTEYIGPIRSGRPTDPTLLKPLGAVFQISGAQPWVQSIIRSDGVPFLGESSPNTFRIPRGGRAYERTLYGTTPGMRDVSDNRGFPDDPPEDTGWFTFGEEPTATTETAEDIALSWSGDWPTVHWVWDGEQYLRFNGETPHEWVDQESEGEQIAADTLVVLTADQYIASGSSGSAVPALDTVGSGQAFLFHSGGVVQGTWERGTIDEWFTITTLDGDPLVLPAGRLWVNIFPDHRTLSWDQ
jgi:hypothetical protein